MTLQERADAVNAVLNRFRDKPFDWRTNATCIHLARAMGAALGHQLPVVPQFRSPLGAKKALRAAGADSLPDLLNHYFPAIPPASAIVGDLVAFPGTDGWHALGVHSGGHKILGWHEQAPAMAGFELREVTGAWRL